MHKIGVIVYNTGDEEVIGFREYLQGYIESNFEMVQFIYSDSIRNKEQEMAFIQDACDQGAEGFMSFLSSDLKAEVALCEKNQAYYLLASGTVSDEDFDAVADNPWFLGMFGPGQPFEFQAGADMARFFIREKVGQPLLRAERRRAAGQRDALPAHAGHTGHHRQRLRRDFPRPATSSPARRADDRGDGQGHRDHLPRLPALGRFLTRPGRPSEAGEYDAVLSVLPPQEMIAVIGKTPLGVVDSYNTRNLQLVTEGVLKFVVGKYSSMVGPAFALMLNAVTGYAEAFRENGKAIKVIQGFWMSDSPEDYNEKYALSASAAMNAYNFDDLSRVIRLYNPDANLNELCALAEACPLRGVVEARRHRLAIRALTKIAGKNEYTPRPCYIMHTDKCSYEI